MDEAGLADGCFSRLRSRIGQKSHHARTNDASGGDALF